MDLLEKLNKEDTYSTMMLLLFASCGNPKYALLNELSYLMDNKSFVNFLRYYEGQVIQIPTMDEINKSLRILMLHQYHNIEKKSWEESCRLVGLSSRECSGMKTALDKFVAELEANDYKLGGIKACLRKK